MRKTERNNNSISTDFTENTIENDKNNSHFSYFQTPWQLLWTCWYCRIL